jgi:predicted GIY-YIG superfamily endonuclease
MFVHFKSIDDLFFCTANNYFVGEGHTVSISGQDYQFVKGGLRWNPVMFRHRHMRSDSARSAVYVAQEIFTGKVYVGSTAHPGTRHRDHQYAINRKAHANPAIMAMIDDGESIEFDYYAIFTDSRDQAFEFEQRLIDFFKAKELVLNAITVDIRNPNSDPRLKEMAIVRIRQLGLTSRREIMVDGVIYPSMKSAIIKTGYAKNKIQRRLKSDKYPDTRWTKELPRNANQVVSEAAREQRKRIANQAGRVHVGLLKANESIRVKMIFNGVKYPSQIAAAKATGVSRDVITKLMKTQTDKDAEGYLIINYERTAPDRTAKRVMVDGVSYESMSDAARALNLTYAKVRQYKRTGRLKVIE